MGGKGGGGAAAAPAEPTVVNNSNPAMDLYLAQLANASQQQIAGQQANAQSMSGGGDVAEDVDSGSIASSGQTNPDTMTSGSLAYGGFDPGMKQPQQDEGMDVNAILQALRGA